MNRLTTPQDIISKYAHRLPQDVHAEFVREVFSLDNVDNAASHSSNGSCNQSLDVVKVLTETLRVSGHYSLQFNFKYSNI